MSSKITLEQAGLTKKSIKKTTNKSWPAEKLEDLLYGELNSLLGLLPHPSLTQHWETPGKRIVQLEEVRGVIKHLSRYGLQIECNKALVLSGTEPALACSSWIIGGLASDFIAYEKSYKEYIIANGKKKSELNKMIELNSRFNEIKLDISFGDCFNTQKGPFGIIDLDFCNNYLRLEENRNKILDFIKKVSPETGVFVFHTTVHLGRQGNSKEDFEEHFDSFQSKMISNFRIRFCDSSPYQSSLPMISLLWILENPKQK